METEQFSVARNNWRKIRTASDLYFVLRDDAKRLAEIGRADLSDKWMNRILQMPAAMDKEAINVVLLMACNELKRNGLIT